MKREVIPLLIFVSLILISQMVIATVGDDCTDDIDCDTGESCSGDEICVLEITEDIPDTSASDLSKVTKAYDCLKEKIDNKGCSDLSSEEKIFSLLSVGKCKSEVLSDSKYKEEIKSTAQSIIALGTSTTDAEEWLLSKKEIPSEIIWFLQIESSEATTCDISYSSNHQININKDKKISASAGSCLSLAEDGYWLRINPDCYDQEFNISCDENFQTNLLYKKKSSSTIYVSEDTESSSAEGKTSEKVNSFCFSTGNVCDYEGSLWATLSLKIADNDEYKSFLPYLITMADDNPELIPESFLLLLTGYQDFENELLLGQTKDQYWDKSGDKFYDTALALYPFKYESPIEKTNSQKWLLEVQDSDGCWKGNIRNTAFLLYSLWGMQSSTTEDNVDCQDSGYYCMSAISCEGSILSEYDCAAGLKCCSTPKTIDTCSDLNGEICDSSEKCVGGRDETTSDLEYGETCCIGGTCQKPTIEDECVTNEGICRSTCRSDEKSNTDDCSTGICCVKEEEPTGIMSWWVWVLIVLIILLILGIIFRNKLRPYWFRIKSKFRKGKPPTKGTRPMFPSTPSSAIPLTNQIPRRIFPPQRRAPARPIPRRKSGQKTNVKKGELDDVLKKLKEMGK